MKKETVVLIPGLGFGGAMWEKQRDFLEELYAVRVFIPNHPGLEDTVAALDADLNQIAGPCHLVAHSSIGVGIAIAAAAKKSNKAKLLSLACFPGWVKPDEDTKGFLTEWVANIDRGDYETSQAIMVKEVLGRDEEQIVRCGDNIRQIQAEVPADIAKAQAILLRDDLDISAYLPDVDLPVLVTCNLYHDQWFRSQDAVALCEKLKQGIFMPVETIGHIPPVTNPTMVNALLLLWFKVHAASGA